MRTDRGVAGTLRPLYNILLLSHDIHVNFPAKNNSYFCKDLWFHHLRNELDWTEAKVYGWAERSYKKTGLPIDVPPPHKNSSRYNVLFLTTYCMLSFFFNIFYFVIFITYQNKIYIYFVYQNASFYQVFDFTIAFVNLKHTNT